MAVYERNGLITSKGKDTDLTLIYPITKKENILDLSVASAKEDGLLKATDKTKLDKVTYVLGVDDTGVYMTPVSTTQTASQTE